MEPDNERLAVVNPSIDLQAEASESDLHEENEKTTESVEKKKKSKVWEHFILNKLTKELKCMIVGCGVILKYNGNTSVMITHLKTNHKAEFDKINENKEIQMKINSEEYKMTKMSKKRAEEITIALAKVIAIGLRPIHMLYEDSFREFMKLLEPRYTIPSRETFMNSVIPAIYDECKNKVLENLKYTKCCTLTFDFWTSLGSKSFITITMHFLNENFEMKTFILKTKQFIEDHTGINIAKKVQKVFMEFTNINLNPDFFIFAVTDGANNMKKAVKMLKWPHFLCFAHILHNSLLSGLAEAKITELIKKCHDIVITIKCSPKIMIKFNELRQNLKITGPKLKAEVRTRWNSTYTMIKTLLKNKLAVIALYCEGIKKLDGKKLSENDWENIAILKTILKPFFKISEMICRNDTSISVILPILSNIDNNILKACESDSEIACAIKNSIQKFLNEKVQKYKKVENLLYLSSFLDPRFKQLAFVDPTKRENVLVTVKELIQSYNQKLKVNIVSSDIPALIPQGKRFKKEKSESSLIFGIGIDKKEEEKLTEFERYIELKPIPPERNPLNWWNETGKDLKEIRKVANIFLSIPASSVASERVFSKAGYLLSQRRTSLNSKAVDSFIFISSNYKNVNP